MTFPHPCSHCGLCCMIVTCPIGMHLLGAPKSAPCPALEWDEADPDQSRCGLIAHPERHLSPAALAAVQAAPMPLHEALGSGAGCCISARVIHNHRTQDFAPLPPETKTELVRHLRHQ